MRPAPDIPTAHRCTHVGFYCVARAPYPGGMALTHRSCPGHGLVMPQSARGIHAVYHLHLAARTPRWCLRRRRL